MPTLNSPILSGDISGTVYDTRIEKLKGYPISTTTPDINQALVFDGTQWSPLNVASEGTAVTVNELLTATAGQTVFNLGSVSYVPGANNLAVYSNGIRLINQRDYTETNSATVTLTLSVEQGTEILCETGRILTEPLVHTVIDTQFISANAGQTIFDLTTITYVPSAKNLSVYSNGLKLIPNIDYFETNSNTVTLALSVEAGTEMVFEAGKAITTIIAAQGSTGLFTVSVSAPAIFGTYFGDGSNLTGLTTNALPLSGGTLTGGLSAPSLSGVFFGDGSNLTGTGTPNALPLSGGTINGNLTVRGNLSATGTQTFFNTVFTTTSAVSVVNLGSVGPALYIGANGTGDIASFYDIDENVEILHVGGNNGTFPNVGVKTSSPNKTLTVNGEISASSDIWTGGSFKGDGSLLTGITVGSYLSSAGGTLMGGITGTTATFSSVSAIALSGTFFGDGSRLTGIAIPALNNNLTIQGSVTASGSIKSTSFVEGAVVATIGSTYTASLTSGSTFILTLTNGTPATITLIPPSLGQSLVFFIKQPSGGSPSTATFSATPSIKWSGGVAPVITDNTSKTDIISFVTDGTTWFGSYIQNF